MLYYYTNLYTGHKGQTRNLVYILEDEERFHLADSIRTLIEHRDTLVDRGVLEYHYTRQGTLSKRPKPHPDRLKRYWNGKDEEALEFLQRCCHFGEYPNSIMLDLLDWQVEDLVNRMLVKIYGNFYGQFANWLELDAPTEVDQKSIFKWMSHKRDLFQKVKAAGLTPIKDLPY